MTATATKQGRALVSRAVIWTGLALGTAVTVLAVMNGIRVPRLEVVLSVVATWALLTVFAVAAAELLRRHHRAIGRHAVRYGKRGAVATARRARRHGGTVRAWLVAKTAPRWESREHQPLMFRRLRGGERAEGGEGGQPAGTAGGDCPGCGWPIPADGTCPTCKARREAAKPDHGTGATCSWGPAGSPSGWPADDPETAHRWARQMSSEGKPYVVTEYPPGGGPGRTVATYVNGKTSTEGASSMPASPSRIKTEHRARRAAARSGGPVPSEWGPVIAQTADFEPEDDGELLEWMTRQVTGLSAWAEALVDFYEHCTATIGIDPKASAMLHDVADAAAQAAETMGAAKARFTEHYELPREFAGNGGLMTHDGRWITGEGA